MEIVWIRLLCLNTLTVTIQHYVWAGVEPTIIVLRVFVNGAKALCPLGYSKLSFRLSAGVKNVSERTEQICIQVLRAAIHTYASL